MNYEPVIGLEVHVELKTASKMFCRCSAEYFGHEPNSHVCPVCLGLPGALPYPNKTAIEWCVKIGLALNCDIPLTSKFDRKNYFYPDLPKGYQISQYDQPFGVNGSIVIARSETTKQSPQKKIATAPSEPRNDTKKIKIRRVHLEEDTAKLLHTTVDGEKVSLIDFNRSGVPLVEIVTEPDFSSASEVVLYLKKLQQIVRYLDVSDADMEKGEMRLEPNVSLRSLRGAGSDEAIPQRSPRFARDDKFPAYKVEIKNINSFRFVERAINYEVERQRKLLEKRETPIQETRGWNEGKQMTLSQRTKEEAHDYRYFPEPDIPPFRWKQTFIDKLKTQLPEPPDAKFGRFVKEFNLNTYDAEILTRENATADYFEEAARVGKDHNVVPKLIANIIINRNIDREELLPAELIKQILAEKKTEEVDEEELHAIIKQVLLDNQKAVSDYKSGKEESLQFLIGQVLRKIGKRVDVDRVRKLIMTNLL